MAFKNSQLKIFSIIFITLLLALFGCIEQGPTPPAKLISIKQGKVPNDYDELYEGELVFDIAGKDVKIHLCTTNWEIVEEGACYDLTEESISENTGEYLHSSRLSGCYFGTLPKIPCEEETD